MTPLHTRQFSTLEVGLVDDGILLLTLRRPAVRNALDTVMTRELLQLWQTLYVESAPYRVVVLTGAGEASFCAGADLKERHGVSTQEWLRQHAVLEQMMLAMHDCPLPVLAAVNGTAFGGGLELVLNCDFAYGCPQARFCFPEPKLGFIPGALGTQWLPRAVGLARAKELCLSGAVFSADDALRWGVLNQVLPQSELLAATLDAARRIRAASPLAVRQVKQALNATLSNDLVSGYRREIELYQRCIEGPDCKEGVAAFYEKRPPRYA
ncbi:MAG: enoyl-CoA hydratase/isomerase family protein [Pseudomonadales bacterium]|jgi:enoyl-CoA hydratase/carnithine racemase|nr:enoyl-CoA hydratase/isomerase family protein [Pseudomonadales bacterium]